MKCKILIEFDIEAGDELTADQAKSAASLAAWDYLTFTRNGVTPCDRVTVHVDGFGECDVTLGEDHE